MKRLENRTKTQNESNWISGEDSISCKSTWKVMVFPGLNFHWSSLELSSSTSFFRELLYFRGNSQAHQYCAPEPTISQKALHSLFNNHILNILIICPLVLVTLIIITEFTSFDMITIREFELIKDKFTSLSLRYNK